MEFDTNVPIYFQVIQEIKKEIINGSRKLGDKLPSSRELAVLYKINPNTANRIYREMELSGLCFTKRGLGTYITEDETMLKQIRVELADKLMDDFVQGMRLLGLSREEIMKDLEKKL